ncbi:leucine carboxyl methyltransferase, involved in regulation of PPA2 [Schizosaccharomyces pombe]|uniref:Leucine carboxyl methyltransferase 1 n=1 Tax=Schizosaccharomyces pombe (strain 972 / ATCC 24843) TaxID=284812 RepID=LCMT1_SCHPO|nr:putative leucine carboxyl methyltransferase Ppm1 [Schizosaccharomyces pombe]O94257.1 RecName: Full=Leucine carboxyl methyltransferase 1; AltName: Full=Protein phosphatase methyltransferase 1; AltName: Full=[Phosphatase 2A protein]-leucine-carboxy methyltransferase 1 [Schizosaccharomyces pombe 972h-]CAA21793.1 leucine carboxyl methyltransferase Ppm1 (predicted) [Schizosaccharomyces pombe]|eukprot:NP_596515.1 putative leucine carboxyl methyltransferase Ppm1 [Schizosaccharomyces pombe]
MDITETDLDALKCRSSATKSGYIHDPFIKFFSPSRNSHKPPIINRGTYVRTWSIDHILQKFIESFDGKKQIISLGAGTDTRVFRYISEYGPENLKFIEFDFYPNCIRKIRTIEKHEALKQNIGDYVVDISGGSLVSGSLDIYSYDIREIVHKGFPGFVDFSLPTIVLSECCLCYLEPEEASSLCRWFQNMFATSGIVVYEPIQGMDNFGKMMKANLSARGVILKTLDCYETTEQQRMRFLDYGYSEVIAEDFLTIEETWIPIEEKKRTMSIEMLDELEEWQLLAKHYCLTFAATENLWNQIILQLPHLKT